MSFESINETVERTYWYDIFGKTVPDEQAIVAKLLDEDVLMTSCHTIASDEGVLEGRTITLLVNCSDVFAWGCADCEPITLDELPNLFTLHTNNPKCGSIQWACLKRKMRPQAPIEKYLRENNGWNSEIEALQENRYDKYLREKHNIV